MKKIMLTFLSMALCSCASMQYGNLTNTSVKNDEYLAQDSIKRISKLKVPARTTFKVYQKPDSVFGHKLVELLRQQGYGVQENLTSDKKSNFHYVVDKLDEQDDVRVSLFMNDESISRAYHIKPGRVIPISAWSHKE
jgi:hypothetical protein